MAPARPPWSLLLLLAACHTDPPPEAPPPSGCGPGMAEIALQEGASLCVDLAPVTVAAYEECVGRALCSARPAGRGCLRDDLATQQKPVNCVDMAQADAFCKSQQKRLLTQTELGGVPFRGGRQIRWSSPAEWTSSPAQPGHAFALRYTETARTFFLPEVFPTATQDASLGFRCGR